MIGFSQRTYHADESYDSQCFVYAAMGIEDDRADECLQIWRDFRESLLDRDGVPVRYELHATKWARGEGRPSPFLVSKARRVEIYGAALDLLAALPAHILMISAPRNRDHNATEHLLRVLDATDFPVRIVADNGRDIFWRRAEHSVAPLRLPPVAFADSADSPFLQMADFAAYALLRNLHPIANLEIYGVSALWGHIADGAQVETLPPA